MSEAKAKYLAAKAAFEETFEKHLQNGVEFISDQVFIDPEVEIAPGAVILPGCILRGKTVIGANCVIGPNTLLENTIVEAGSTVNASQCYDSHLGPNNKIGPFTHVRTGTVTDEGVHLGAYVETKNANFAEGNTVSHLTYIGDADVGKYCNFGCGTVTCNYDGEGKYRTTIGDYAFIGCNTNLVARSRWAAAPLPLPVPPSATMCRTVPWALSAPSRPKLPPGAPRSWKNTLPKNRSWKPKRKTTDAP